MSKDEKNQEAELTKQDISQLSSKQLEKLLQKKQKEEKEAHKRAKKEYEQNRDAMIKELTEEAKELNDMLVKFKQKALQRFEAYKKQAERYGDIRSNSKGGFSLRCSDGTKKVSLERNTKNEFDERAEMAADLIKQFLEDTVKKRDKKSFSMIMNLLSRNAAGDFNTSRVFQLFQLKDEFDDERWGKAMQLMQEAYNNRPISYSLAFFEKDEYEKDKLISLSFPSIDVSKELKQSNENQKK